MCMTVEMCVGMYECLQRPVGNERSSMVVLQVVANCLMRSWESDSGPLE